MLKGIFGCKEHNSDIVNVETQEDSTSPGKCLKSIKELEYKIQKMDEKQHFDIQILKKEVNYLKGKQAPMWEIEEIQQTWYYMYSNWINQYAPI